VKMKVVVLAQMTSLQRFRNALETPEDNGLS
jgi:hypothetical protein